LIEAPRLSPEQLSLTGVVVALACLALVFVLRIDYVKAIASNLRHDWLDFSRPAAPLLRQATPGDLELAENRVRLADPVGAALALHVLWLSDQPRAVRALLAFLRHAPPAALPHVQPLLEEILRQAGSASAQEIQRWLDDDDVLPDAGLAGELGRHRLLPERLTERLRLATGPAARGATAVTLWQGWRVRDSRLALDQIEALLVAPDEPSVLAGLRSLGQLGEPRYAYLLRDHLRAPSPAVRRSALIALRALASPASRVLLPELLAALADGTGEERELALDAFERIGDASALGLMLTAVGTFTPAERRRAEQLILHLGPRCVPTLIAAGQDPNQTVTARSVTLRALGKLALPQLQLLATPLVDLTARKAYYFLGAYQSLAAAGASDSGRAVLCRIYRDFPNLTLEIVLETLTVAGRLPSFEAIMAALRGGQSKDRGYAIEAIEQACSRETFALLLPLIDGRSLAAQVEFGRARGLVPTLTPAEVVERSLQANFPLEAAAASAALFALDPAAAAEPLLARLRRPPNRLLRETIVTLLARRAGRSSRTDVLTPVEVIDLLMQSPDLAGCMFMHHEFLASHAVARTDRAGSVLCRRGEPLPGLWFVLAGAVRGDAGTAWRTGDAAGAAALHGTLLAPETLTVSETLQSLFLPTTAFQRCVELFPELGVILLRNKLAA
jgi:HEAT repeat protein